MHESMNLSLCLRNDQVNKKIQKCQVDYLGRVTNTAEVELILSGGARVDVSTMHFRSQYTLTR